MQVESQELVKPVIDSAPELSVANVPATASTEGDGMAGDVPPWESPVEQGANESDLPILPGCG